MIFNFGGKLTRAFIHYTNPEGKEEPAMMLFRKGHYGRCAIIPLSCAYKYDEPKSREDRFAVYENCLNIAKALDFPTDKSHLIKIATTIQDGLDELIKMPPKFEKKQVIGEGTVSFDGGPKHKFEVTQ